MCETFQGGEPFCPPHQKNKTKPWAVSKWPILNMVKVPKGSSDSRVLLKIFILFILGEFPWWSPFPVELQVLCLPFCGGGLLRGWFLSILFFYCVNCCFGGNCRQWLVHSFKYTFHFNLHGRKALGRALLAGGFLVNISYCISSLLHSNSALVIYRAFLHRWLIHWHNAFINLQLL